MTEQVLPYDPVTKKRRPPVPGSDAAQNDHHVPTVHPLVSARDFSRPHTIDPEEYEQATGRPHADDLAAWKMNEEQRKREEKERADALAAA